ncbi:MAG: hypothetical protein LR015_03100 [Verrucomicrobia bacterium]|nr:hypothetical protein [Verrucomicrobiota bacterium]
MKRIQYTVRDIPVELDQALRERMRADNVSFEHGFARDVKRGCGLGDEVMNRDFDDLAGKWVRDKDCDTALDKMRATIDPELWQ